MIEKEIYLIRHGETDLNRQGIVQGRGVNAGLNECGHRQAQAFYRHFAGEGFEVVYASSLLRTRETVAPFIAAGCRLEINADLDEISWGIYEGKLPDPETSKKYQQMLMRWQNGEYHAKIPGGESPLELQQRQVRFIESVLKPAPYRKILICSHGRAMRAMLCTMLQQPLKLMDTYPHQNLSLYKVLLRGDQFELLWFNHTTHLTQLGLMT
ncbi:MAG: phosphoglycerate mutase [Chitinophagales bacterium]|nr:MAG: phosphoglycerate mutase [Chitinophagales bacterium]